MLTAFAIREAGPLDARLLAGLHRDCFQRPWDETAMARFASAPGTLCLIGATGEGAAREASGLLIARKAGDEAEILTFGVVPPCRNKGLGRALLQTAVERLRASGAKQLFLEVEDGNEAALRLYRSCGAEAVGRRQGYYEHGADAAIFSLAL
ncbi:MAG: GNAT family N-acetyltransferase [Methyloceanibacter sp.]